MVGTRIKHYEIERLLGDGGMGAVYLARDTNLGRPVAVKVLLPELLRVPDLRARLAQEARTQGKLSHPGIVAVYDFDLDSGAIVMEYVEGRPLDQAILDEGGPLPLPRVKEIFRQIVQAVAFAHRYRDAEIPEGIVHRDLKPANILLRETPTEIIAKVTDFGVARIVGDARRLTSTGTRMGTLWYMSPEQVRSPMDVDHRSDVYALGVVLFEMLTGAVPFDGTSDFEVMSRIVQEDPPQLSALNAGLPPAIEVVLSMALAKDREDRFQSCEALWTAFEEACAPPVIASPSPVGERAPLEAPSAAEDPRPSAEPRERSLGEVWASLNASARAAIILLGVVALVAMLWPGGRGGGGQAASPSLSPEQVVRAWVAANSARDTDTMMSYYAPRVQWYNLYLADYELHTRKAKHHRKFDLRNDETMSNPTVRYNGDRTRAIVDYDSSWRSQSSGDDPFWFDARRRIRLKRIDGRWLIDCEEEIEIYRASNPKAEGTDLCEF